MFFTCFSSDFVFFCRDFVVFPLFLLVLAKKQQNLYTPTRLIVYSSSKLGRLLARFFGPGQTRVGGRGEIHFYRSTEMQILVLGSIKCTPPSLFGTKNPTEQDLEGKNREKSRFYPPGLVRWDFSSRISSGVYILFFPGPIRNFTALPGQRKNYLYYSKSKKFKTCFLTLKNCHSNVFSHSLFIE